MAKRFTKPQINWTELQKLVPSEQKAKFLAFKAKSEAYLRRVESNPAEAPKINWEEYKKSVPVPGLVDKLKSSYESFKVPYPSDTLSAKVDEQWTALQPEIKAFCDNQQKVIQEATKELQRIEALPKIEEMTMETYYEMFPKTAFDPVNRPTFWPHSEDEQLGYIYPEQAAKKEEKKH